MVNEQNKDDIEMQPATFQGNNATMSETTTQQNSLKELAGKVLERNHQCNAYATRGEKE